MAEGKELFFSSLFDSMIKSGSLHTFKDYGWENDRQPQNKQAGIKDEEYHLVCVCVCYCSFFIGGL